MAKILLVNNKDKEIGFEEKLKVHKLGLLHRAFSILIFNNQGELLIQKRAKNKYHSNGLWSNTCCSHQGPKEPLGETIHRRLKEEIGIDCQLRHVFDFSYEVKFANGLIENEIDHVFIGVSTERPKINPKEVSDYRYLTLSNLKKDIKLNPEIYTEWFKIIINKHFWRMKKSIQFFECPE